MHRQPHIYDLFACLYVCVCVRSVYAILMLQIICEAFNIGNLHFISDLQWILRFCMEATVCCGAHWKASKHLQCWGMLTQNCRDSLNWKTVYRRIASISVVFCHFLLFHLSLVLYLVTCHFPPLLSSIFQAFANSQPNWLTSISMKRVICAFTLSAQQNIYYRV